MDYFKPNKNIKSNLNRTNDKKIRLFGEEFVQNNKDNFLLIIDDKIINICENYDIKDNNRINDLEVILIQKKETNNMSYMFSNCKLPNTFSNLNTSHVTNMNSMFYECSSLESLPDISKWNINKVTDMSYMFYQCSSLKALPDISDWNTNKVNDMSYMFYQCSSL